MTAKFGCFHTVYENKTATDTHSPFKQTRNHGAA